MSIVLKPQDPGLRHLILTLEAGIKGNESYEAKVAVIIDGDTLDADLLARTDPIKFSGATCAATLQPARLIERVRLLGIDAPEAHAGDHANQQCQHLGIDLNELLLLSKLSTIHLQWLCPKGSGLTLKTTGKARDDYGRILAGVYLGDLCINRAMVEHGYAMAYHGYSDWEGYGEVQARAQVAKAGIWGQCTELYYPASASTKTYHRPGCSNAPKAGTRFNSVTEAKAKGFKSCQACIPDFRQ